MPTLTELLPPTASSPHSALQFTASETVPHAGLLLIDTARARVEYLIVETDAAGGRAFHLAKVTPGTDAESEEYSVFVGRAGSSCSCKGFAYGRGKPCKHLLAVAALLDNHAI